MLGASVFMINPAYKSFHRSVYSYLSFIISRAPYTVSRRFDCHALRSRLQSWGFKKKLESDS